MTTCVGILWAQYGPYHFARAAALTRAAAPVPVRALELAGQTRDYQWWRPERADVVTICPEGCAEGVSFWEVFRRTRRKLRELRVNVCLLPSYSPAPSLAALLAAKSLGIRAVMMNESHAGTARATGLAALTKRRLVRLFDAALVGGAPQRRYFAALGLPEHKIFTGYDAVDNDYFAGEAEKVRADAAGWRRRYGLPAHYFLNLGRFVAKKNLETLIRAYGQFLRTAPSTQTHLVLVGSGDEEARLRELCSELRLSVTDHGATSSRENTTRGPGVHFYGFRQIDENPVFYALAEAFILPSVREEWGLVVNEAMASGLPVVVSETAGCAEDLLEAAATDGGLQASASGTGSLESRMRKNGFVFNPHSARELTEILLLLDSNPTLRQSMGRAGRQRIEKFSCAVFAENALGASRAALNR